jgi:hypothetical protein
MMPADVLSGFVYPSSPTATWLTADEKDALVARLECDERDGVLDVGSILPLRRLNALPGLASAFSCTGHKERPRIGGYLTLRTSCEIARMLDADVIDRLWADGLVCHAMKEWQYAFDATNQPIPRVIYDLRFRLGQFENVCDAVCHHIKESTDAVL